MPSPSLASRASDQSPANRTHASGSDHPAPLALRLSDSQHRDNRLFDAPLETEPGHRSVSKYAR